MKILSLSATGIANKTFNHELAAVTVFTGPNAVGKTTRLNALNLAMAGYVPNPEKKSADIQTNSVIYETFATARDLQAQCSFDNGQFIRRTWNGGKKITLLVEGLKEFSIPVVMLNAGEFIHLSERERVKFVFSKTTSGIDRKKLFETIIANLKSIKCEQHTPEAEAAVGDVVKQVQGMAFLAGITIPEYVEVIYENLKVSKANADAAVKRMAGSQQALTQAASDDAPVSPDCEQQLTDKQNAHGEIQKEIGRLNGQHADLTKQLTEALAAELKLQGEAKAQELLTQLEEELVAKKAALPPEPKSNDLTVYNQKRVIYDLSFGEHQKAHEDLATRQFAVNKLESQIASTKKAPVCKHCGKDPNGNDSMAILKDLERQFNEENALAQAAVDLLTIKQKDSAENKVAMDSAYAEYQIAVDSVTGWRDQHNAIIVLERRISRGKELLAENNVLRDKVAKIDFIKAGLLDLEQEQEGEKTRCGKANEEITRLKVLVQRLQTQRAEARQRAQIDKEAQAQRLSAEVLKAAVLMMDELRAKLVEESVAPLVANLNRFSEGMFPHQLEYKDGKIGYSTVNGFVDRTLCNAEKATVLAAISVALANESPLKILVLDNMVDLDDENMEKFTRKMLALVKQNVIDQVVMATDTNVPFAKINDPDFLLIKL